MSYLARIRQSRQQALQTDTNANKPDAWIGAVINGTNTIQASQGPAWVWVTLNKGGDRGNPQQVINRNISPVWDCPVKLGVNSQGQPYIIDVAESQIDAFTSGNSGGSLQSLRVGPHSHEYGMGNYDLVSDRRLVEGLVWWRGSDGPFTVYINPYWYFDGSGVHQYYAGGPLDLISTLTVVSGQHQWIKVGLDPSIGTPVAVAGTAVSVIIPLQNADLAAISFTGYIPLRGVQITYGQAIQGEGDFTDCSQVRNGPGSGGTDTDYYQTVQGNGSAATQRPIIDFIDGTNTTVTVTDDGAGTRTKVKIDASGSGGGSPEMAMAFAWFIA